MVFVSFEANDSLKDASSHPHPHPGHRDRNGLSKKSPTSKCGRRMNEVDDIWREVVKDELVYRKSVCVHAVADIAV